MSAETMEALVAEAEAALSSPPASPEALEAAFGALERLMVGAPEVGLQLARRAQAVAEQLEYRGGIGATKAYEGYALYMLSRFEEAMQCFQVALPIARAMDDQRNEARVLGAMANVCLSLGDYAQALAWSYDALKILRTLGNRVDEAWMLHGIGLAYIELGDDEQAHRVFTECLALFEEAGMHPGVGRALSGLGTVHLMQGRIEEARACHERSLAIFRDARFDIGEARALNDLGRVAQQTDQLDAALAYHRDALRIRRTVGNRQAQTTSLLYLGEVHLARGETAEALAVLQEALDLAEAIEAKQRIYWAHEVLSAAYEQEGDLAQALAHHKAFHAMREEVQGDEVNARIKSLQVNAAVEQAEREAELTRRRNEELRGKNEQLARLLQELKAAQAQLIQQEKMASLGALTAGIAHEIKNPLNFVNNFAALSAELIDELEAALPSDALSAGSEGVVPELLADVRANVERIHTHGLRADRIIKSMMLHARGTPDERRAATLNELLDEYVDLAYHGMRAQHPDFNVDLQKDYGADVGEVVMAVQEVGRVFINLLSNAFYAVRARGEEGQTTYQPVVHVQTRRAGDRVTIRVRDNGPGIPAEVQQRIFEPFFTTKPTGEGTGLGLSISYDVVVNGHGGTLAVESTEGEGATFVVTLPRGTGN